MSLVLKPSIQPLPSSLRRAKPVDGKAIALFLDSCSKFKEHVEEVTYKAFMFTRYQEMDTWVSDQSFAWVLLATYILW